MKLDYKYLKTESKFVLKIKKKLNTCGIVPSFNYSLQKVIHPEILMPEISMLTRY